MRKVHEGLIVSGIASDCSKKAVKTTGVTIYIYCICVYVCV